MEFEVKIVGGLESCFVSIPLSLIQSLQSTNLGFLPPVLALELRSRANESWHLAWSGSASQSSAIEVAQQLAECIALPDHILVQVKALANFPKATMVMIEPSSEDDWEILELNSEVAEVDILKQVGIVYEGMKFPLWLHGHTIVRFLVVSTSPRNLVVQLVPGTEIAVAPKIRKMGIDNSYKGEEKHIPVKGQLGAKALLRVQESDRNLVHRFEGNGVKLSVPLTSVVCIHPETATRSSFNNLQLVTVFSILSEDGNMQNKSNRRNKNNSNAKEGSFGVSTTGMGTSRHILVHILLSDSVAKGHVILPRSLRLYLRVNLHSWVYVQRYGVTPKKDIPSLKLSPCWFKLLGKDESFENNDLELLGSCKAIKSKSTPWKTDLVIGDETIDWSLHEEVLSALWLGCPEHEEKENRATERMESLVRTWLVAQLNEMALHVGGTDMRSLVLGKETLIHFEVDMSHKLRNPRKQFPSSGGSVEKKPGTEESSVELLFLLMATFEEASCGGQQDSYELSLTTENNSSDSFRGFELPHGKLEMGTPISLDSIRQRSCDRSFGSTISSLSWMEAAISDVLSRLQLLLSPNSVKLLSNFDLPLPGHVLIYGPPGSGKTLLAMAVAKYLEEHGDILAHIVFVNCSKLAIEKAQTIRQTLVGYISEALDHSPSLVILDDLDGVVSSSSESEGSQPSNSVTSLTEFLADIIDEYGDKNQSSCRIGPIAFMSSAQSLGSLPQSLTSSGRFDFHVQLPAPVASDRSAILKHGIHKRSLLCSDDIMSDIASKCDGYDAYDLEILLDRAVHAAVSRFLPSHATSVEHEKPSLIRDDFSQAMHDFTPVAMRGITKSGTEGGRTGWVDVGGLSDIRKAIEEMVELPAKFPNIFSQAPLRLRSNVLLYGPPGCGKTHIVGAAAAACSLRFISIKGPELLNKYIGASEQAVRDIFSKAAAASPCLLFFDEFDSIAPKRGHDNTGVTDRVVNQLLTELDGVETLTGVFVFAATSRPDLLDAALLRPGRLDRLLFCNFPSKQERLDILRVLSRKLPLAGDVDLDAVASMTEGFSGADLQALLSDAQLASVHELLESGEGGKPGKMPVIDGVLMKSVASTARPSVTEAEKHRLYGIYNQFLDSRKSVAAKTRDAKGKRATLA